jgi:hypothetical protein
MSLTRYGALGTAAAVGARKREAIVIDVSTTPDRVNTNHILSRDGRDARGDGAIRDK